eukprot:GILK01004356.1.p1 GENE.GILK01004356.1~~GILK01004356.1.p1  ORF type:complete len:560 (-),score=91.05 GILK01004356.1:88-1767(-)
MDNRFSLHFTGGALCAVGSMVDNLATQALELVSSIPPACLKKRAQRDGDHFHITLLSKAEVSRVVDTGAYSSKQALADDLQLRVQTFGALTTAPVVQCGVACAMQQAWFVPVLWTAGALVRQGLSLQGKNFHITLGFKETDVHDDKQRSLDRIQFLVKPSLSLLLEYMRELKSCLRDQGVEKQADRCVCALIESVGTLLLTLCEQDGEEHLSTPARISIYCDVAMAQGRMGLYEPSLASSRTAYSLLESTPEAASLKSLVCVRLASALMALGQTEEVLQVARQAVLLDSTHKTYFTRLIERLDANSVSQPEKTNDHSATHAEPMLYKFPRTSHLLALSDNVARDDLMLDDIRPFCNGTTIVTCEEKIDGANLGISIHPETLQFMFQNRSHFITSSSAGQFRGLDSWLDAHRSELFELLDPAKRSIVLFGEWMYAKHSIQYDRLPNYFIIFDIFDYSCQQFYSVQARNDLLESCGVSIPTVPIVAQRPFNGPEEFIALLETESQYVSDGRKVEGVYLRIDNPDEPTRLLRRAKLVRADFIQTVEDGHWCKRIMERNQLSQ